MNITGFNQTDGCLPYACPERSVSTAVYVLLYICAAAVVLLTVFGNLLIIISVCHFKQLHTPTNMLILSLAVSDFLVGAFVTPIVLIWTIESCWIFKRVYCMFFLSGAYFLTSMSIYNIALIAADRYFALSNPFFYTEAVSVNTMCVVVLCEWLILLSYILALLYLNFPYVNFIKCPGDCFLLLDEIWSLVDLVVTFVFPFTVIIVLYVLIFIIAKKHATAIRELNAQTRTQTSGNTSESVSERKAARAVSILIFVFMACLFPYFIYTLLGSVVKMEFESFRNVLILLYLNSAINPIIYALFYPWFRKCVKLILTFQIFKTDSALINIL
uniref:Trace amine-associated receptor 13c-like n=1 Tax=Astyanax mexicanus TaxID=7994 RepID=A0A3B1IY67_ASTMX